MNNQNCHHRYVAYKKAGFDYADIPKIEKHDMIDGDIINWKKVKYEDQGLKQWD